MTKLTLYAGNDQILQLNGVTDSTGTPIAGAALTGALTPVAGGATTTLTFGDVPNQAGNYTAPLSAANVPAPGTYRLTISGSVNGLTLSVQIEARVVTRTL